LTLPHFDRHNGKTAKNRALTAKRVAKHKANGKVTSEALSREEKEKNKKTNKKSESTIPPCPHSEIIDLFHETLPEHQRVVYSLWDGTQRAKDLQARWRQSPKHQSLDFWCWFFESVKTNPHWMGENDRNWRPTLEWLVKKTNFIKVVERGSNAQRRVAS
ncbi:MAG: hypothetical protein KZQ73_08190, partial [Candidatus Thiodiazotropha sp. (ex Semelilucina semeliformis)]|nr:hypothetical protein [Candidatus Thiodiazotropha sp. (ex Semelilucina semeliformis)]